MYRGPVDVDLRLIGVPVFGDHSVLNAKHIEPERLMMLAVYGARPGLANVNDDHVVIANHVEQFALVIDRNNAESFTASR